MAVGAAVATAAGGAAGASTNSFSPVEVTYAASVADMFASQCWSLLDENSLLNTSDLCPYRQRRNF